MTNQEIINEIQRYYIKNGVITKRLFPKSHLAAVRFGSWNNALIASGVPLFIPKKNPKVKCLICNKETSNKKFCSRSCSAINRNRVSPPPRRIAKKCLICENDVLPKRMYCQEHNPRVERWKDKSIQDVLTGSKAQLYSVVRQTARKAYKDSGRIRSCIVCKYDKHIEICHIKAVNKFSKLDKLSDVNNINNLIPLCPNHHWEFDNGCLSISDKELESLTITIGA